MFGVSSSHENPTQPFTVNIRISAQAERGEIHPIEMLLKNLQKLLPSTQKDNRQCLLNLLNKIKVSKLIENAIIMR